MKSMQKLVLGAAATPAAVPAYKGRLRIQITGLQDELSASQLE